MHVFGENRKHITLADLPPPVGKQRWVPRKKAAIIAGIEGGLLSPDEACERYSISTEELDEWQQMFCTHGLSGLQVTKTNIFRGAKSMENHA